MLQVGLKELGPVLNRLSTEELEELYFSLPGYDLIPVGINTFLDDPEYLGSYWEDKLYPYWREVLNELYPSPTFSPYWLVAFRGAVGQGKTVIACTGIAYDLYRLLCMSSPQQTYNLINTTKILFAIFNVTLSLAHDVVWDNLNQMFMASPFFNKMLGPLGTKPKGRDTLFPKRLDFFMGSRIPHTLGKAVFEAILSEANFEIISEQVYKTFNSLLRRMESRFIEPGGGIPGKIWIDSSESDKFAVVNKIIDRYKNNPGVFISQVPLWAVAPHRYGGKKFWVYAGSDVRQPQVLINGNQDSLYLKEPERCIQVPEEHRSSFEAFIEDALRDLAGIATGSKYRLFKLKEKLKKAEAITPLFPEEIELSFVDDQDQVSNYCLIPQYFGKALNRGVPRHIHIDTALSGDRLGIAASYISNFVMRKTEDVATLTTIDESVPVVITEWCFGLKAKPGDEIPLFKVRGFIDWIVSQGYPIGKITCDGFQSSDMLQQFRKRGFSTDLLSMDKDSTPYVSFRNGVYEDRVRFPISALLFSELENLELSPDGTKVDHPAKDNMGKKGTKDLADAVGGSVYTAMQNASTARLFHYVEDQEKTRGVSEELKERFWGKK